MSFARSFLIAPVTLVAVTRYGEAFLPKNRLHSDAESGFPGRKVPTLYAFRSLEDSLFPPTPTDFTLGIIGSVGPAICVSSLSAVSQSLTVLVSSPSSAPRSR